MPAVEAEILHLRGAAEGRKPVARLQAHSESGTKVVVDRHTHREAEVGAVAPKSNQRAEGTPELLALKLPLDPPTRTCALMAQCSRRTKRYCGPAMKVYWLMLGLKML